VSARDLLRLAKLGYTPAQVMAMPLPVAAWLLAAARTIAELDD